MSLFSLIAALLLEQLHPLASRKYLFVWLTRYVNFFQHHLNTGEHKHGKIAWLLAVLLPLCGTAALYWLSYLIHPVFAWAFSVMGGGISTGGGGGGVTAAGAAMTIAALAVVTRVSPAVLVVAKSTS